MSNQPLFLAVGSGIFIIALLFCHAFEVSNSYIYYPLAVLLGYNISMKAIGYVSPTAFDPPPPPAPRNRQEKKKQEKEAELQARRNEKLARKEADATRKAVEARERG
ncbi:hypothetical protein BG011_004038 [Mortierella polycephala]|uniref:Uncharacterized protein n=1 Tax=Mortierella polycephala TaxID=41804 RepID=A0A9P6Q1K7_9FUNG|nr:hypothetical protein BG011_004038 [Mortierella polycephala]